MPKVAEIGARVHVFRLMCGRQLRRPLYRDSSGLEIRIIETLKPKPQTPPRVQRALLPDRLLEGLQLRLFMLSYGLYIYI